MSKTALRRKSGKAATSGEYSKEYKGFLKRERLSKTGVITVQVALFIFIFGAWELGAQLGFINTFIMSSPSAMWRTLVAHNFLLRDMWASLQAALIGFFVATALGTLIAITLWWSNWLRRVLDPYLTVFNSLPKIALGPIIIIWFGIGMQSIVIMNILIMIVITVLSVLHALNACDPNKIQLLKSMNANKFQILWKLVLPNAVPDFISVLKINVGLTWVGTIMGEYLVSRAGLGHQIVYGGSVFNLNLVMTAIVVLCALAGTMYLSVAAIEKWVNKSYKR